MIPERVPDGLEQRKINDQVFVVFLAVLVLVASTSTR